MSRFVFRAFDHGTNLMSRTFNPFKPGGFVVEFVDKKRAEEDRTSAMDGMTFMQWTGLKDNEGKRIFEGDIVGFDDYTYETSDNHTKAGTSAIEYIEGSFWLAVGYDRLGDSIWVPKLRKAMALNEHCRVIGNIFQNREWLK